MPSKITTILEYIQYRKFNKAPVTIYVDLESLIERMFK